MGAVTSPSTRRRPGSRSLSLLRQRKEAKKGDAKPLPSRWSGPQMSQLAFGRKDKLAALKHVFPLNPNASRLIWQRPNAEHVNSNRNGAPSALRSSLGTQKFGTRQRLLNSLPIHCGGFGF